MTGRYEDVVGFLKERAPDFAASPEYQPYVSEDDLPGPIMWAFGKYLGRVARENGATDHLVRALEELSEWQDASVQAQIRDEVFWGIENDHYAETHARKRLTGRLRKMYETWKAAS